MILVDFLRHLLSFRRTRVQKVLPPLSPAPSLEEYTNFASPFMWASDKPQEVFEKAKALVEDVYPGYYIGDNMVVWGRNMSMFTDQPFVRAWQANTEAQSDEAIAWRRYVLACAAYHCVQLKGDFVECGAYTCVGIKTVVDYLGGTAFPKTFWGYDAFEHDASMLNHRMPQHGGDLYERMLRKFENYPQVRLVKGLIPQSFDIACPKRIAYLHIDLNQAPAEIAALDRLFDLMVPGGVLLLDDYDWGGIYRPQKIAEDAWFDARHYRVMPLPTGQGLVIKR